MRNEEEIQAAHDRFVAILLGDVPNPFTNISPEILSATTDALCWVLRHAHNRNFEENLRKIDEALARSGYVLRKRP